jgi:hypothetical protein
MISRIHSQDNLKYFRIICITFQHNFGIHAHYSINANIIYIATASVYIRGSRFLSYNFLQFAIDGKSLKNRVFGL